jgi:hypothetical protein
MSVEAIDQVLGAWEERLKRVDDNLLALEADATYQALSGATTSKRAPLEGATKARVAPALDALIELFEHRGHLTDVLDRAKAVRESISALTFWNTDEKLKEVQALLHGPSIKMGAFPRPLALRNLLDPATQDVAVVPEQLLEAMAHAYEVARDAVTEVAQAWETLEAALERIEREAHALRAASSSLGVEEAVAHDIESVERELVALRALVARDPLGVSGNIEAALGPQLSAMRQRLDALGALRDNVTTKLARARTLRQRLDEVHAAARHAVVHAADELDDARSLPTPVDDAALGGLDPWLARIEGTARAGRWSPATVGLTRWFEVAEQYLATDRAITDRVEALTAQRTELKGRLSARRAQARALAARGAAFDPTLEQKAEQADALLRARPTSLARASALVEAYEAAVVLASRR